MSKFSYPADNIHISFELRLDNKKKLLSKNLTKTG